MTFQHHHSTTSAAVTEFESLGRSAFSDSGNTTGNNKRTSGLKARWERKRDERPLTTTVVVSSSSSTDQDRFIPNRAHMNMEMAKHSMSTMDVDTAADDATTTDASCSSNNPTEGTSSSTQFNAALGEVLLGTGDPSRVLAFGQKPPTPKGDIVNNLNVLYSTNGHHGSRLHKRANAKLVSRSIPSAPTRILDAPDMLDDYYLNLLSWSDTNVLAVALGSVVYLWNAGTGDITELCSVDEDDSDAYISSVSWVQQGGQHVAVGTSSGQTQLWDVETCRQLRSMDGHSQRVGALAWNQHLLSSGGRDAVVVNHDVRVARHKVATMAGAHTQEVCQLSWSLDGQTLASGGNDNQLLLWDVSGRERFRLTDHQAAVKALAWSPHERNLLASGGGTADRCIKFWNTSTGTLLNSIDTESQVCALQWNPFEKELLSSHGFSRNHLCLWKYPSMVKVKELEGHSARVLHMALSPDGGTVVSAAADETLRFWNVFGGSDSKIGGGSRRGAGGVGNNNNNNNNKELPMSADFLRNMQIR